MDVIIVKKKKKMIKFFHEKSSMCTMIGDITYRWKTNNLQMFAETLERRVYHRNFFSRDSLPRFLHTHKIYF